jgi:hypothetical protein
MLSIEFKHRDSVWKQLCDLIFSRYVLPEHVVLDLGAGWREFSRNVVTPDYLSIGGRTLLLQGFSIERRVDRFLPYTMSTGRNPPLALVNLYLRIPFFWPFLRK